MELLYTILIVVVVLIALYFILGWLFQKSTKLTSMQSGTKKQHISSSKLPNNNNSSNYAYSTWFYVEDWNYRYGEKKSLLERGGDTPCPNIYLGERENDIHIQIATFSSDDSNNQIATHVSTVRNFPLQKWVNLTISLYGRTLDIYIDGKLVQSDIIDGVAKPCNDNPLEINTLTFFRH